MPDAVKYYVPIDCYRAKPQVTTGFETNHPVHNCLDFNLDSYALPTAAAHSIVIDRDANFGTYISNGYTFFAVWLANFDRLDVVPYLDVKLETSTDAAFTTPTDLGTKTADGSTYLPLIIWEFATNYDRYIRLTYSASAIKAKTALVLWGITYNHARKHEWQTPRVTQAVNAVDEMGAGRRIVRNFRFKANQRHHRLYRMISDQQLRQLRNLFELVRGRWMPFIIRDDPDTTLDRNCLVARFTSDDLEWIPQQHDLNDVVIAFEEVPFTYDKWEW